MVTFQDAANFEVGNTPRSVAVGDLDGNGNLDLSRTQLRQALNKQGWRKLITTVLLSATTLLPSATRLMTNTPSVAQTHSFEQNDVLLKFQHDAPVHSPNEIEPGKENVELETPSYMSLLGVGGGATAEQATAPSDALLEQKTLQEKPTVSSPLRGFCHPLNGKGLLSQGIRGLTHQGRMEYAYDLAADIGTPVYAMRSGRVIAVEDKYPDTGGGKDKISKFNYVWIEHDGGYRSVYMHLQQGFVSHVGIKAEDWVESGQLIGYSGNSGWSTGPHLHLEVQKPGSTHRFTATAPFAISGSCDNNQIASN